MSQDRFKLVASDEYPHPPEPSPNFNESVYVNAFDAASGVGGWMRIGNRANEGYAELSVCLYLPDGKVACRFARPTIADNARFSAGGLAVEVLDPLKAIRTTYDGELMLLDDPDALRTPETLDRAGRKVAGSVSWTHDAASPLHGGLPAREDVEPMYGRDFSRAHFNQHSRVTGHLKVGDREWRFDGHGWRDHSWGPRYWQAIWFYRLFTANFGDGRGFMMLKITDRDGRARRLGVLMYDGDYEDILDIDVLTEWTPRKDPARVRLGVRTAKRAVRIDGEVLTLAPLRNRRRAEDGALLVSRIAEGFTRFTWDGAFGYGMTEYIERIEGGEPVGWPL